MNQQTTRNQRGTAALLCAAATLAACGGGSDDNATVNAMSATPAAYSRTAVWTISGFNLDQGITFAITQGGCENLAESGDGTAFQRQFSCRITTLGVVTGQVNDAGGSRLASLEVSIPQPVVRLALAQGNIDLELDPERAPVTVDNFLSYVGVGFYNNTIYHRVIQDFVIQGGGFVPGNPNPSAKPPIFPAIALETNKGLSNLRGTLAMARTSVPDSATSQFYINTVDNLTLDYSSAQQPGYAVFGRVTAGLDLVDAISVVPTRSAPSLGLTNLPVTDVIIVTARQIR